MGRTALGERPPSTLVAVTDVLLATSSGLPDGGPTGYLLLDALERRGVSARWVAWDDAAVDWSESRLVVVRSLGDHADRHAELLAWAEDVERWTSLLPGSAVLRWNTDRAYLLDLARAGVPVVPTELLDDASLVSSVVGRYPGPVVVKPRVGASGRGEVVLDPAPDLGLSVRVECGPGPCVVQPVLESVRTEGELWVFWVGGAPVSQARTLPAAGELGAEEPGGGHVEAVPLDDEAVLLGTQALAVATELLGVDLPLARVDLVRADAGRLLVGALELTEPGLCLDVLPENADALADLVADLLPA